MNVEKHRYLQPADIFRVGTITVIIWVEGDGTYSIELQRMDMEDFRPENLTDIAKAVTLAHSKILQWISNNTL